MTDTERLDWLEAHPDAIDFDSEDGVWFSRYAWTKHMTLRQAIDADAAIARATGREVRDDG